MKPAAQVVFQPGQVVEYVWSGRDRRYGIVVYVNHLTEVVNLVEFGTGAEHRLPVEKCRLRHGYLHVDRESFDTYVY